jgi:hypothetical protein
MVFTKKKYGILFRFAAKCHFFVKLKVTHLGFELKFDFFKTHKNLYIRPLCVTDSEYGGFMTNKYRVSVIFSQTDIF